MSPATRRRLVRYSFGVVGVAFVVVALWQTWDRSRETVLPPVDTMLVAGVLVVGGLVGAGRSWLALFGPGAPRRLMADFYLAQLGKYIPGGGVWQAAGQVGLSASREIRGMRVAGNLAVHAVVQLTAAASIGGFLVFATDLPFWIRLAAALALASPLLLHRSWMASILGWAGTRLRVDGSDLEPPDQRTILRSWLWSLLPIGGFGLAYGLMIHAIEPGSGVVRGALAFALAWAAGFALLPFPAGLGVREAALMLLLESSTAAVIATSLALRLLAIIGEVILMLATRRIRS